MNRDEFRLHMNNYKEARESNPSLSYWLWKANKYEKGTDEITDTTLPEVVVTPKKQQELDILDSPYLDLHYQYESKPRFELRKGTDLPARYTSSNYLKGLKALNKSLGLLGIIADIPQYLFPSKEDEILDDLNTKIKLLNDILLGKKIQYSDGTDGIVDELKSNSRTTLTPEEQQYLLNKSKRRQRMSGAITPIFDIQDAVDFTPIGDILTARDT